MQPQYDEMLVCTTSNHPSQMMHKPYVRIRYMTCFPGLDPADKLSLCQDYCAKNYHCMIGKVHMTNKLDWPVLSHLVDWSPVMVMSFHLGITRQQMI